MKGKLGMVTREKNGVYHGFSLEFGEENGRWQSKKPVRVARPSDHGLAVTYKRG